MVGGGEGGGGRAGTVATSLWSRLPTRPTTCHRPWLPGPCPSTTSHALKHHGKHAHYPRQHLAIAHLHPDPASAERVPANLNSQLSLPSAAGRACLAAATRGPNAHNAAPPPHQHPQAGAVNPQVPLVMRGVRVIGGLGHRMKVRIP